MYIVPDYTTRYYCMARVYSICNYQRCVAFYAKLRLVETCYNKAMTRVFIISLLAGLTGMILANSKGRNPYGWFLICFLFPLSALVLIFLPPLIPYEVKRCPDCGGTMSRDEVSCPDCKKDSPIEMVTCSSCGVIVRQGSVCDNCGKPMR